MEEQFDRVYRYLVPRVASNSTPNLSIYILRFLKKKLQLHTTITLMKFGNQLQLDSGNLEINYNLITQCFNYNNYTQA